MRNRQPELFAAALITYAAAAAALVLRMVARRKMKVRLTWEDYLAIVAFFIGSGFTFICLFKTRWGLGIPLRDIHLPVDQIVHHYFLELWADMWLYTFSVGLSKFVILGLYWRMFRFSIIRQPIRVLFALSVCWIIARVTLILMQCQPIHKFWDQGVPGVCRLTPMTSLFAAGIPHFILEVAILLCPLIEVSKLQLQTSKKIAVAAMFMSGILVCCSALGTIVHTVKLDKKVEKDRDLTWDGLDAHIWAVCDVNLASFATSLPLLRPVFRSFYETLSGVNPSTKASEGGLPGRSTHGSIPASKPNRATKFFDTESMIHFAEDGNFGREILTSSEAYALQRVPKQDVTDGIPVKSETRVDSHNV